MKKSILIFICLLPFFVIGQNLKYKVDYDSYSHLTEKYYVLNSPPYSIKQGKYELYNYDNVMMENLNYKNDELDGICEYYYKEDCNSCFAFKKPMEIFTYKNGKKVGTQKYYDEDGNKIFLYKEEVIDNNGKYIKITLWFSNGFKQSEIKIDRKSKISKGTYSEWNKNNDLIKSAIFEDDDDCLYIQSFSSNFRLEKCPSCIIKDIDVNGKTITKYYKNGSEQESPYYENGKKKQSGDTTFYESGKIKSLKKSNESAKFSAYEETPKFLIEYYENGKIKSDGKKKFYENGQLASDGKNYYYENGKLETDGINNYYKNGQLETDGINKFYEDGKPEYSKDATFEKTFNKNGIVIKQFNFSNGELKEWYDSGKIKSEGTLKNSKKIGKWANYDEQGNVTELNIFGDDGESVTTKTFYDKFMFKFGEFKDGKKYKPSKESKPLYEKVEPIVTGVHLSYNASKDKNKKEFEAFVSLVTRVINLRDKYVQNEMVQSKLKDAKTDDDVKGFIFYFDSIEQQSLKISEKLLKIESAYSIYSEILKQEIKPLSAEIKSHNEVYYSAAKFGNGKKLIEKLDLLNKNFEQLKKNDSEISNLKQEFENKLQDSKPNKQLYKKGNSFFKELSKKLEQESNSSQRIDIGNKEIIPLLKKLISLSTSDNAELNLKIKDAISNGQIKTILGL